MHHSNFLLSNCFKGPSLTRSPMSDKSPCCGVWLAHPFVVRTTSGQRSSSVGSDRSSRRHELSLIEYFVARTENDQNLRTYSPRARGRRCRTQNQHLARERHKHGKRHEPRAIYCV